MKSSVKTPAFSNRRLAIDTNLKAGEVGAVARALAESTEKLLGPAQDGGSWAYAASHLAYEMYDDTASRWK